MSLSSTDTRKRAFLVLRRDFNRDCWVDVRRVEAFDRGGAFHAALDADRQAVTAGEYLVVSLAESGWYQATLSLSDIASGEVLR